MVMTSSPSSGYLSSAIVEAWPIATTEAKVTGLGNSPSAEPVVLITLTGREQRMERFRRGSL